MGVHFFIFMNIGNVKVRNSPFHSRVHSLKTHRLDPQLQYRLRWTAPVQTGLLRVYFMSVCTLHCYIELLYNSHVFSIMHGQISCFTLCNIAILTEHYYREKKVVHLDCILFFI